MNLKTEGCNGKYKDALGKLLNVPKYADKPGYNFTKYEPDKIKGGMLTGNPREVIKGRIAAVPLAPQYEQEQGNKKIYIASKTKHADKWIKLRGEGVNIISTWIDDTLAENWPTDMPDLCLRCIKESKECDAIIVYAEPEDILRGAFIEMGIALAQPLKPIYLVGEVLPHGSAFTFSHQVFTAKSVEHAISLINDITPAADTVNKTEGENK